MEGQAPLLDRELLVVTGKGGVGKTTVAAALALACARTGRRVIVCEVSGQAGISRLFDGTANARDGDEVHVIPADDATGLRRGFWATTIDAERALAEWAAREVLPRALVEVLVRSSAFSSFVNAAPGARELVTATKAWELGRTGGSRGSRWTKREGYDVVILDAPASGHGLALMRTPRTYADIARIGPVAGQARRVAELFEDDARSAVVVVTRPEETPVNETLDLEAQCQAALGHGPALIVANAATPSGLRAPERALVDSAGAGVPDAVRETLDAHDARARLEQLNLRRLRRNAAAPVVTLPLLAGGQLDGGDLGSLADGLANALE